MSNLFILSDQKSELKFNIFPPLELNPEKRHSIALTSFFGYNNINNVQKDVSDLFVIKNRPPIKVPPGTYDIDTLFSILKELIKGQDPNNQISFMIRPYNNRVVFQANFEVDFTVKKTVGPLLGFIAPTVYLANTKVEAPVPPNIFNYHVINVECNIGSGAYFNGKPSSILHSFCPKVPQGYRIIHTVENPTYIAVKHSQLDVIQVRITDEQSKLLDFGGEEITVVLQLIET